MFKMIVTHVEFTQISNLVKHKLVVVHYLPTARDNTLDKQRYHPELSFGAP